MRKETQFSVHKFASLEEAKFDPREYSFLKFGSNRAAKKMGYELADAFFMEHAKRIIAEKLVIIPSPYNYVKNAATVLSEHFVDRLNHHIIKNGGTAVEWSIINRKVSYIKDYGFLDKDSRRKLIDQDEFFFNCGFLEGKTIVCIDDVNITGTHEDKLREILDKNNIQNDTFFLYFAKYIGSPGNANIEAALNFSGVHDANGFIELTKEADHHCIVRPIKYLMGQEHEQFKIILSQLPMNYVGKMYNGCLSENYHNIPEYKKNFEFLQQMI